MEKIALSLLLAVTCAITAMATDIVTLTDGRVMRGRIVTQCDSQTITIEDKQGLVITYPVELIKNIRHEEDRDATIDGGQCRGFRAMADVGAAYAFSDSHGSWLYSVSGTAGYQLNRMVFLGGGLAPSLIHHTRRSHFVDGLKAKDVFMMPIYVMARLEKKYERVSPFAEVRIGDNFIGEHYKGFYGHFGLGCRINHFNIMAGYTMQHATGHGFYDTRSYSDIVSAVGLRIGCDF